MEAVPARKSPHIRPSTNDDMRVVRSWLEQQDAAGVTATFLCNWNLTLEQHEGGELLVYIDEDGGEAIAYQWGGLVRPGILEVRADRRGQGIGKAMVEHRLVEALERNEDLLFIQCKPSSSIPFWKRMGFELVEGDQGKTYGHRTIRRRLNLPAGGQPVEVSVEWFPEERKWEPHTSALATFAPAAVLTPDGDVHLAERIHWFDGLPGRQGRGDIVLRILVTGQERYCDKAKYEDAACIGLQRCRNGFFLDRIYSGL